MVKTTQDMIPSSVVSDRIEQLTNTFNCELVALRDRIDYLDSENLNLRDRIGHLELENDAQQVEIEKLKGDVCALKTKAYEPDLRAMLNLFHRKLHFSSAGVEEKGDGKPN